MKIALFQLFVMYSFHVLDTASDLGVVHWIAALSYTKLLTHLKSAKAFKVGYGKMYSFMAIFFLVISSFQVNY